MTTNDATRIDRIDVRGNIREHLTLNGVKTLCGLALELTQPACGNGLCKRCENLRARCQNPGSTRVLVNEGQGEET